MPDASFQHRHPVQRYALLAIGWLSLALGIIGIFLPLLPTTPFVLLAAACFMRSSERLYLWLTNHPRYGVYIKSYLEKKGIPLKAKLLAMFMMWTSFLVTIFVLTDSQAVRIILPLIGVGVSWYLLKQPTYEG